MTVTLITGPSVYLVGAQRTAGGLDRFLADHGLAWESDAPSPGELMAEVGGRTCYHSFARPRPGGNAAYLGHILEVGHGSVLEHAVYSLILTGVSRSLSHELVRHRHLSPSQLSQRYVDSSDVAFVVPPALLPSKAAWDAIDAALGRGEEDVDDRDDFEESMIYYRWLESIIRTRRCYARLADELMALPGPGDATARRKAAREAARSVLPNCAETRLMLTGNARAWRGMIEQRGTIHADREFRRLAVAIFRVLEGESPNLFGDMEVVTADDGLEAVTTAHHKV